ncbi:MAG: Gfo/Idh/MocA family oxidoreductase [Spirochaetales bacterium]|nr:Gfo/Idh/MocA family oxidoreductase [Spirochaetales bacterium]
MALIGAGTWGSAHAEIYSQHHLSEFVAVCDSSEEKAKKIAQKYGVAYFTDYEEMFEKVACDAVGIVTPDFAHAKPIIAAANRNKHILCEKPLATTQEDLDLILNALKGKDIKVMVDFHNRWNPPVCKIKSDVDEGKIGKIVSAYIRLNDIIYVPMEMLSWAEKSSILWFLGSHSVDVLNWIIGALPEKVYSVCHKGILESKGINVPDLYQTILEYSNGAVATMENSWILPNTNPYVNDYKLNITGEKGMFNMDFSHNTLLERFLEDEASHPDVIVKPRIHGKPTGLAYESIRDFIERVYNNDELIISIEESVSVTRIILAIMESVKKKQPVKIEY